LHLVERTGEERHGAQIAHHNLAVGLRLHALLALRIPCSDPLFVGMASRSIMKHGCDKS
jgi:hypothetical protein